MLDRYLRQSAVVNQEKLARSKVLVVGVGGLGNFVATELVLAGVGTVHIADKDTVEIHNLNRQFLFNESDIGEEKAKIAEIRLKEMNQDVEVKGFVSDWREIDVNRYDIVFDCLDIWEEKRALMDARDGLLITGSVGEDVGFASVLVDKHIPVKKIRGTCTARVLGARVGVVGSIMANEGIREISGDISPLRDRMLYVDFRTMRFTTFEL